jgi:hypothetical protein
LTILDSEVFDDKNKNVSLPKDDFANNILKNVEGFNNFDVAEFSKIFEIIQEIVEQSRTEDNLLN